ncbi:hypothetical protein HanXRQr2_Chr05g0203731 [Helianthus annuus]|uniref:Uncharacterized protein n=1 Tax=Helianthus annuus TaxID=4232 RepID=A0A9K3NLP1_HELAN|nr:hypothetical protein HanXRQr2_Chr05g0203731 [Helianthus annuus]KAJ0921855.1 hypothetical protein HanPSC8_Chr05g0196561 [Helianthus annuus]
MFDFHYLIKVHKKDHWNLENMTNSRKDLVGKDYLCMTDHEPPSAHIINCTKIGWRN